MGTRAWNGLSSDVTTNLHDDCRQQKSVIVLMRLLLSPRLVLYGLMMRLARLTDSSVSKDARMSTSVET